MGVPTGGGGIEVDDAGIGIILPRDGESSAPLIASELGTTSIHDVAVMSDTAVEKVCGVPSDPPAVGAWASSSSTTNVRIRLVLDAAGVMS